MLLKYLYASGVCISVNCRMFVGLLARPGSMNMGVPMNAAVCLVPRPHAAWDPNHPNASLQSEHRAVGRGRPGRAPAGQRLQCWEHRVAGVSRLRSSSCLATTDAKTPDEGGESQRVSGIQKRVAPKGTAVTPALSGSPVACKQKNKGRAHMLMPRHVGDQQRWLPGPFHQWEVNRLKGACEAEGGTSGVGTSPWSQLRQSEGKPHQQQPLSNAT